MISKKGQAIFMPFIAIAALIVIGWVFFGIQDIEHKVGESSQAVFDSIYLSESTSKFLDSAIDVAMREAVIDFANNGGIHTSRIPRGSPIIENNPTWFYKVFDENACQPSNNIFDISGDPKENYRLFLDGAFNKYSDISEEDVKGDKKIIISSLKTDGNINVSGDINVNSELSNSNGNRFFLTKYSQVNPFENSLGYALEENLKNIKNSVREYYLNSDPSNSEFPEELTLKSSLDERTESCTLKRNNGCGPFSVVEISLPPDEGSTNCLTNKAKEKRIQNNCGIDFDVLEERCPEDDILKVRQNIRDKDTTCSFEIRDNEHRTCSLNENKSCECASNTDCVSGLCLKNVCVDLNERSSISPEKEIIQKKYDGVFSVKDNSPEFEDLEYVFGLRWLNISEENCVISTVPEDCKRISDVDNSEHHLLDSINSYDYVCGDLELLNIMDDSPDKMESCDVKIDVPLVDVKIDVPLFDADVCL